MVVDKLVLLSPTISHKLGKLAREEGGPTAGYERCIDFRRTRLGLPARLFYRGRYNKIHKLEIIGVARLGLPYTQKLVERIFPNLLRVRIYRIDFCVDILGYSPWFFVTNLLLARHQNYALYRSRGAVSLYLQFSKQRKLVFYDRLRLLRKERNPMARLYAYHDHLTRIELQLSGAAVPFKRFMDIQRYAELRPVKHVRMMRFQVEVDHHTAVKRLAAYGLRWLISKCGLQPTARMFSSPEWAALRNTYLREIRGIRVPRIGYLMRKSVRRWLKGQIYFPRARS